MLYMVLRFSYDFIVFFDHASLVSVQFVYFKHASLVWVQFQWLCDRSGQPAPIRSVVSGLWSLYFWLWHLTSTTYAVPRILLVISCLRINRLAENVKYTDTIHCKLLENYNLKFIFQQIIFINWKSCYF